MRREDRSRDCVAKSAEYRELGVKESWIIDRFCRLTTVLCRRGNRWVKQVL